MSDNPSKHILNGGDMEDEEEDDWNPQAEVGSDDELDDSKIRKEEHETQSIRTSRPVSKSRSQSRAASIPDLDDDEDDDGVKSEDRDREISRGATGRADDDGEDDGKVNGDGEENEDEVEDDEDEDEEDDDDDDEVQGHRQKRRKRQRNQYIDVEAEVDEDEDEDEDEDDLPQDFVADEHPEDEGIDAAEAGDDRRHRELDRRRMEEENLSAEQIAQKMSERYADYGKSRGAPIDSVMVPQRLLVAGVDDPTIWGVRCRPGKEREIVFAITKRIEQRLDTPGALNIMSAFERGGTMAGFVYVEARTKADVKAAVDGIINVFMSRDMVLVPIQERPDLLGIKKSKTIEPGMWVRMKRGLYKDDLAYVEEVHENGLEVELKIVPREDYGANEDLNAPMIGMANSAFAKRKRQNAFGSNFASRPPAKLFNEHDARKYAPRHLQQVDNLSAKKFQFRGNTYVGGFLMKTFKVNVLQAENVNPTLQEVSKFTSGQDGEGADTLDLQRLAATLKQTTADSFLPGDAVEIYSGEQRGVVGTAISVRGDIVTLRATEGELKGSEVDAPVKDLRKRFQEGDHVKVIGGSKYIDEVGMVVKIRDNRVTLLSDATNQEITVFSKDLRAATDSGSSNIGGKYDLHDLVQLDPATVGIVVKVDRESLRILSQTGEVRTLLPSAIAGKLERRRFAVSTDKEGTEIRNDDTIKETAGDQRQGRVVHIHRSFLFIQNRQLLENSGIFVARTSGVIAVASKGGRAGASGPDLTRMNPNAVGSAANSTMAPPTTRSTGRDRLIGKTCTMRKGPYKGLLGIIKDTTDTEARVELHTKAKVITVPKDTIAVKDPITGQNMDMSRLGGGSGRGGTGGNSGRGSGGSFGQDHFGGGMTPARPSWGDAGGRTPAFGPAAGGGKTPAWSSGAGGKTPGWSQPNGGRTPAAWNSGGKTSYGGANDGSRTSYGGGWGGSTSYGGTGGGQTAYGAPSWGAQPGNATPWQQSNNAGGRTPAAWTQPHTSSNNDSGNRTAYGTGAYDASTPFNAPTPGTELGAEKSRSGVYGSARTPGAVGGDGMDEGYE